MTRDQRNSIHGGAVRRFTPGGTQCFKERRVEDLVERAVDGVLMAQSVELFEAAVPAQHAVVPVQDREPVVQRFEDVLAELAHPVELFGLYTKLPVQSAVLERCRR